jgi:hypothetical protein
VLAIDGRTCLFCEARQRVLIVRKYSCDRLIVCIHGFGPLYLKIFQRLIDAYPVCSQNPEIRRALADLRNRALPGRQKRAIRLLSDFYGITLFRARSRFLHSYELISHRHTAAARALAKEACLVRPARRAQ